MPEASVIEEIRKLFESAAAQLGPVGVLLTIAGGFVMLFAWRVYQDWSRRNDENRTVAAKDETIQLLNEQNRQFRVEILLLRGMPPELIDSIVLKNSPKNTIEARELLEKNEAKRDSEPKKQSSQSKRKRS